tara:strand:+ start:2505 stop:2729 length:225 start_codon:yes stop_codon:yes gene_type:complete
MENIFRLLSENFSDDRELGEYIRMLGDIPDAELEVTDNFSVEWTLGEGGAYRAKTGVSLDDLLKQSGLRKADET